MSGGDRQLLAEQCLEYRARPSGAGLAIVVDDVACKKLLAAFSLYPLPEWRRPRRRMPLDIKERWLWLWEGYEGGSMAPLFLDDLAPIAGISSQVAFGKWPSLMISRLVYPDGWLSPDAETLLRAHVVQQLPKPPPPAKTPTPKKG